jgi:hypothetical protein
MPNLLCYLLAPWLLLWGMTSRQPLYNQSAIGHTLGTTWATAPQQRAEYSLDTGAILTNRRLPQLLALARRAPLVRYPSAQALPTVITSFLASTHKGRSVAIADVGGEYEATDALSGAQLPRRQLLYLGISKNIVLLAYNLGGIINTEHILLFHLQGSTIQDFWAGSIHERQRQTTKEGILHYLQVHQNEHWGLNTNRVYF